MIGNYFSISLFHGLDQLQAIDHTMTENVTSDDPHDHNNDFCLPI